MLSRRRSLRALVWLAAAGVVAVCWSGAPSSRAAQDSPAAAPRPATETPQDYAPALVEAGGTRFAADCAFCHGREATGGSGGPDLTRSELVAADVRGDQLGPMIRAGRPGNGMPAFALDDDALAAVVAFIHHQKDRADELSGGRQQVTAEDLQTGDATAGRRYFEASCARCHSATGDLAGIGGRLRGLALLQQMLYPRGGRGGGPAPPTITVTLPSGPVTGALANRDEFTIALRDADGWYRSWSTDAVTFTVDDPRQAHVEQLGRYTDGDMHDVLAYLQTLR
jgi:cytochrome c oxidase cbb3-type subunit 3